MTRIGPVAAAKSSKQLRELDVCTIPSIPLGGMRGGFEPFSWLLTDSMLGKIFSYPQIPAKSQNLKSQEKLFDSDFFSEEIISTAFSIC